jgi:hypothetical protein
MGFLNPRLVLGDDLMKVNCKALEQLLSATSREQHINGKAQKQVSSCVLVLEGGVLSTTSIVKDGKTSLARFSFATEENKAWKIGIPVPDIERLMGVLKYHSGDVTLTYLESDAVKVKSKSKQTTLTGGWKAKAFSNSQVSVKEWNGEAVNRAKQIKDNVYIMKDGSTRSPFCNVTIACAELHDALRCDGINGQKLNRYTFQLKDGEFGVSVGDTFKGQTDITFGDIAGDDFSATFEGGLEHVLKHYSGDVKLSFLDFRLEGQGIRLIMSFGNGDWVFQAGVL